MKQFIISTTFVVILVMVVISMAIIIPSTKIYEQTNNKIIDNQIDNVEINENQVEQSTGIRNGIDREYFSLTSVGNAGDNLYRRVLHNFSSYVLSETAGANTYTYYLEETLEIIPVGEVNISTFELDIFSRDGLYQMQWASVYLTGSKTTRLQKNTVSSKAEFDAIDINAQTHTITTIATDNGYPVSNLILPTKYAIDTTLSTSEKIIIYYKTAYIYLAGTTPPASLPEEIPKDGFIWFTISFSYQPSYTSVTQTSTKITNGVGTKPILLLGNELITNLTTINSDTYTDIASAFVLSGYANGKETATVLCDISEYYDDNLVLSISTQNNALPMIFNVGDIVIPYVTKNVYDSGTDTYSLTEVPLSIINGNPKLFKVVSNKIISDGVPRQKLTLVESDKLYVDNTTTCIATDITAVGLSITTPTELTYIPTSDNLTTFTFNPRIGDGIKLKSSLVKYLNIALWKHNGDTITFGGESEYTTNKLDLSFIASATTVGGTYECLENTSIASMYVILSGASMSGASLGIFINDEKITGTAGQKVYPDDGDNVKIICQSRLGETISWAYDGNPITSGVGGYTIATSVVGGREVSTLTFVASPTNIIKAYLAISS